MTSNTKTTTDQQIEAHLRQHGGDPARLDDRVWAAQQLGLDTPERKRAYDAQMPDDFSAGELNGTGSGQW